MTYIPKHMSNNHCFRVIIVFSPYSTNTIKPVYILPSEITETPDQAAADCCCEVLIPGKYSKDSCSE